MLTCTSPCGPLSQHVLFWVNGVDPKQARYDLTSLWKIMNKILNMTPSSIQLSRFHFSHLAVENIERPATPGFWVDQKQYRLLSTCFWIKVRFQLLLPSVFGTHRWWGRGAGGSQQGGDCLEPRCHSFWIDHLEKRSQ